MLSPKRSLADWNFTPFIRSLHNEHLLFDIPVLDGPANATIHIGQQELVNFAGINFLGFQQDEEILSHFIEATRKYGMVTGGARLSQGVSGAHQQLEELICTITGKERAITFASGLLANLGFLQAMGARVHKHNQCSIDNSDTVFVLDQDSHWSLRKGVERFPANQQRFYFEHNNPGHLREVLARLDGAKVVVIFESVYSSDGGIAPIGDLLDVCEEYNAISYVDDANGFLIYGPEHRPFANDFAQLKRATFVMMSLSKSIGLEGGAIAGPSDPIRAFELLSGTSLFTAALQPPTASTACAIMHKLLADPCLMDDYLEQVNLFRAGLAEIGCQLNSTPTYIISVFLGEDQKVEPVRRELLERGYLAPIFHYPGVKFNEAVIRLIPNRRHTEEQRQGFIEALKEVKGRYHF